MTIGQMLRTHPPARSQMSGMKECIEACFDCYEHCVACADACLGEADTAALKRCIGLNLDCADVCLSTGSILLRQTEADEGSTR